MSKLWIGCLANCLTFRHISHMSNCSFKTQSMEMYVSRCCICVVAWQWQTWGKCHYHPLHNCTCLCVSQGCQGVCGAWLWPKGDELWVPGRPAEEPHWDSVRPNLSTAKAHHCWRLPETGQGSHMCVCVSERQSVCANVWLGLFESLKLNCSVWRFI